jgi:hypothetical protein
LLPPSHTTFPDIQSSSLTRASFFWKASTS